MHVGEVAIYFLGWSLYNYHQWTLDSIKITTCTASNSKNHYIRLLQVYHPLGIHDFPDRYSGCYYMYIGEVGIYFLEWSLYNYHQWTLDWIKITTPSASNSKIHYITLLQVYPPLQTHDFPDRCYGCYYMSVSEVGIYFLEW
jgi:hypothetical protein